MASGLHLCIPGLSTLLCLNQVPSQPRPRRNQMSFPILMAKQQVSRHLMNTPSTLIPLGFKPGREQFTVCRNHYRELEIPHQGKLCPRTWSEANIILDLDENHYWCARLYRRQWHDEYTDCVLLQSSTLPANDDTARRPFSTKKSRPFYPHWKNVFPNEPDFSQIDQLAASNDPTLETALSILKGCDEASLEEFYRSTFKRLDSHACKDILDRWMGAMSPEVLLGIQNAYLKEQRCGGLCFWDPSPFNWADYWRYERLSPSHIARKPWRGTSFPTASPGTTLC